MDQVNLTAEARATRGTRPAKRLRREGQVPAVVYGRGHEAVSVSVDAKQLYRVLHTEAGLNAIINLELTDGETLLTVAREVQRHPVRGTIDHLDFIQVSLDVEIEADVQIDFQGEPVGVVADGGIVETLEATIALSALPTAIPSNVAVDISALHIGDTLRVSDLPELEGVTYLLDDDAPLLTVAAPRLEEVEEEPIDLEEGEEPGEDEGEDGDEGDEG